MSDFFKCKDCSEKIFPLEQHVKIININKPDEFVCVKCFSDSSVERMLSDKSAMEALKLLKYKGYAIDKICMMLEHYDFTGV
jgi:hypothetical protein